MTEIRQIPLAERIRGVIPGGAEIPTAMGLYTEDLMEVLGEMTGEEEYGRLLGLVRGLEGDSPPGRVFELVEEAFGRAPEDRTRLLFWLLAKPFALLYESKGGEDR